MYFNQNVPEKWKWFVDAKFGLFIHWGPYSVLGRGEQVLFREHLDQAEYEKMACGWDPVDFDAEKWARLAKKAGFKYACLTTRHHDGYCLWDSAYTDYTSMRQAPKRDLVKEYTDAFRKEGLKVGLYYSWLDWRIPSFYLGPKKDPEGWKVMKKYLYDQIEELMTKYGKIDYFFFDGVWPRNAEELGSEEVVSMMRRYQPDILINNRLGYDEETVQNNKDGGQGAGGAKDMGDFQTPENTICAHERLWESCMVSTWRLWGYTKGERWLGADKLLDMLTESVEKGGNLILNVGPDKDGRIPPEFIKRAERIGEWMKLHSDAIYGAEGADLTEFVTRGRQLIKGNSLYLIIRFWDGEPVMRIPDMASAPIGVTLMTTGEKLNFEYNNETIYIKGLPEDPPTDLFPVIKIDFAQRPSTNKWGEQRLWGGDPERCVSWAEKRGRTVFVGK